MTTSTIARTDGTTIDYLDNATTKKLLLASLRRAFPGTRFGFRSRSGGSAADVSFDGSAPGAPSWSDVNDLVSAFRSGNFDGSIDLAFGVDAYIDDAGDVVGHRTVGSAGSGGYYPALDDRPANARCVHFAFRFLTVVDGVRVV